MTDEAEAPTKLTATKQLWAREGRFLTGRTARPGAERLPPGQHLVTDWPVLDLGMHPAIPAGAVDAGGVRRRPAPHPGGTGPSFRALKQTQAVSDIHCVTSWSRYDNVWEGVATRALLDAVAPRPDARFVLLQRL